MIDSPWQARGLVAGASSLRLAYHAAETLASDERVPLWGDNWLNEPRAEQRGERFAPRGVLGIETPWQWTVEI